jgi:hypothetical protein
MGCWATHGKLDCSQDVGLLTGRFFKKTKNPTLNLWRDDGLGNTCWTSQTLMIMKPKASKGKKEAGP